MFYRAYANICIEKGDFSGCHRTVHAWPGWIARNRPTSFRYLDATEIPSVGEISEKLLFPGNYLRPFTASRSDLLPVERHRGGRGLCGAVSSSIDGM
jgi:hypothetical protein